MLKKKLLLFMSVALLSLSLSGCMSLDELKQYMDNYDNTIDNIEDRNINFISKLNEQGFLSNEQAESWKKSVSNKIDILRNIDGEKNPGDFIDAITSTTVEDYKNFGTAYMNDNFEMIYGQGEQLSPVGGHPHSDTGQSAGVFYELKECDETIGEGENEHECGIDYWAPITSQTTSFDKMKENVEKLDKDKTVIAFRLYDDSQVEQLRNALAREVYVINNFDTNNTPEKLQVILAILNKDAKTATNLVENYGLSDTQIESYKLGELAEGCINQLTDKHIKALETALIGYCAPLRDENGNSVTYLQTEGYAKGGERYKEEDGLQVPYIFADTQEAQRKSGGRVHIGDASETANDNTLGRDLYFTSNGKVSMMLRIMEFNPDLIDILNGQMDTLEQDKLRGKYYITQQTEKYAIKLDYPLYKISSIETDSLTSQNWYTTISNTGLYMDVKDGYIYDDQHIKMNYNDFFYNTGSSVFWKSDYVNPKDTSSEKITMEYHGVQIPIRPLVLLDYVELYSIRNDNGDSIASVSRSYKKVETDSDEASTDETTDETTEESLSDTTEETATESDEETTAESTEETAVESAEETVTESTEEINKEFWIPIGRRLRVSKLEGDAGDIENFAQSLTFEGELMDNPNLISLANISDKTSGYGFFEDVNARLGLGLENESSIQKGLDTVHSKGDQLKDKIGYTLTRENFGFAMDAFLTKINPVMVLGTEEKLKDDGFTYETPALAHDDHDNVYNIQPNGTYLTPTVYGMCTGLRVTEANLTGSWLGNTESSSTGVVKWNNWLSSNHFKYSVDIYEILKLMGLVFDAQTKGENAIVFDEEALEVVYNELKGKTEAEAIRWLRTVSRIFGFIITSYGMLLLGAWMFDTNVYAGPKLVRIMTFGKWEAIRDKSDIGGMCGVEDDFRFVDLRDMVVALIEFTAIGVLLWYVDFFDIKELVERYVGPLMETIRDLIIG